MLHFLNKENFSANFQRVFEFEAAELENDLYEMFDPIVVLIIDLICFKLCSNRKEMLIRQV